MLNEILPDGTMLSNDTPLEAEVSVIIKEQENQQITVQSALIEMKGTQQEINEYVLSEDSVSLQLTGSAKALATITTGSIPITADVTDLTVGEHIVALEIDLPEGVTLVGETPEITITISEKEQQTDIPEENEETDQVITETEQPSISEE